MSMKQVFLALALVMVLGLAAPRAQAQVVGGGGYVGFGAPGFGGAVSFGTPVAGVAVVGAPVVPYVAPYPVVVPRPSLRRTLLRGRLGGLWAPLLRSSLLPRRLWAPVVRCLSLEGTSAGTVGRFLILANYLTGGVSTLRQMYQLAIVR